MPIAIALLVRSIIQLLVTAAIYKTAEAFIGAALDILPRLLSKAFGISEQESRDFIHDFMIDQALAFGLTVLALRKKMPTIVAEKLGFTSRGFSKFGFGATARTAIEGKIGGKIPIDLAAGTGYWKILGKFMGGITAIFMLTQSVEVFAYRPQFFVNILSFFGLEKPARSFLEPPPKPLFSDAEIQKITDGLVQQFGAGFSDEELQFTWKIDNNFTVLMLEAATDDVFAQQKLPTQANVLKSLRESIIPTKLQGASILAAPAAAPATTISIPKTRVFTGIISQGTLGETIPLSTREADIISSPDELRQAAQNNLAVFIQSLPGRIVYEIKLMTRIVLKDGTIRAGTSQKITTGFRKDGSPIQKTIINRFAVANIYAFTARNVRSKIDTIILGPVDIIKFNPQQPALDGLSNELKTDLTTTSLKDVQIVQAAAPVTPQIIPAPTPTPLPAAGPVALPLPVQETQTPKMTFAALGPILDAARIFESPGTLYTTFGFGPLGSYGNDPNGPQKVFDKLVSQNRLVAGPVATTSSAAIPPSNNINKCSAATIANFFDVNSSIYPSVSDRGKLYETFGLGLATLYTGTAEQNLKLLTEFKRRSGCPGF